MKIVAISDTHNSHNRIIIPKCDLLLFAGDMSGSGYSWEIEAFAKWFATRDAKHKVAIPGNHDYYTQQQPEKCKEIFQEHRCHLLIDEAITIEGLKIYGSPWQPWFHDWAWNFSRTDLIDQKDSTAKWAEIPNDTNILITHGPPLDILDTVARPGKRLHPNVGCPSLRKRIKDLNQLKLHVFGHIHESYGQLDVDGVKFVNAAINTLYLEPTNAPTIIEL